MTNIPLVVQHFVWGTVKRKILACKKRLEVMPLYCALKLAVPHRLLLRCVTNAEV